MRKKLRFVDLGPQMMYVSACGQPVSPGPFLIGPVPPPVYTIGGMAFGASDYVSEVQADLFDEVSEDESRHPNSLDTETSSSRIDCSWTVVGAAGGGTVLQAQLAARRKEMEALKDLFDAGLVDEDEYKAEKQKVLQKYQNQIHA